MKKALLWFLAFVITLSFAYYQRKTGPTHSIRGKTGFENINITYKLKRSHGGEGDQEVVFKVDSAEGLEADLLYKRYRTNDDWTTVPMTFSDGEFKGFLPHQPPAGKLAYTIELRKNGEKQLLVEETVITRFKGAVPLYFLIPHIFLMFCAVFVSVRTVFALIFNEKIRKLVVVTTVFLGIGGMILGPIVQKYAFGDLWTGVPFGWDFTDNKTLVAFLFYLGAYYFGRKEDSSQERISGIAAIIVMLAVYLVPHSVLGSEYDYEKGGVITGKKEVNVDVKTEEIDAGSNSGEPK